MKSSEGGGLPLPRSEPGVGPRCSRETTTAQRRLEVSSVPLGLKLHRMASNKTPKKTRSTKPLKQPPILYERSQKLLLKLEQELGGTLLTYWNNPRGAICDSDVVAFFEVLERVGRSKTIYLLIRSDGGNGQASLRIVNLIRKHCERFVVLVPLDCASAATMIALGANEIQMGPMAYLTAVDTSLTHDLSPVDRDNERVRVSLDELRRVVRLWRGEKSTDRSNPYGHLYPYVHPLVIGAVDRASSLSVMLSKELLSYHIGDIRKINRVANALNTKYPSHSYPVLPDEAKRIGLNVTTMPRQVHDLLLQLNEAYSEMGQKAVTDFDEIRSHGNEITNILEARGVMVYFQLDKDWFYRAEERRWITLNDNSGWRKAERVRGRMATTVLHIT